EAERPPCSGEEMLHADLPRARVRQSRGSESRRVKRAWDPAGGEQSITGLQPGTLPVLGQGQERCAWMHSRGAAIAELAVAEDKREVPRVKRGNGVVASEHAAAPAPR